VLYTKSLTCSLAKIGCIESDIIPDTVAVGPWKVACGQFRAAQIIHIITVRLKPEFEIAAFVRTRLAVNSYSYIFSEPFFQTATGGENRESYPGKRTPAMRIFQIAPNYSLKTGSGTVKFLFGTAAGEKQQYGQ
jgi:hypothetical protein